MALKNKKILILVADMYEDLELHYPRYRMKEEGADVVIAGEKEKCLYKSKHGYPCTSDISFNQVNPKDYEGIIIPGGYAPDTLRSFPKVLEILKQFDSAEKMIAFICHAGWVPLSAKILKGVKCTSYHAIKDDMINAGANWSDQAVVIDRHFISSRCPDDLPQFCSGIIKFLNEHSLTGTRR